MDILSVLIFLVLLGAVLWVVEQLIPDPSIKRVARVFVLICAILVVLNALGVLGLLNRPVPQVR